MLSLRYWFVCFFTFSSVCQISYAATCSPSCGKKFRNCHRFQTGKNDKTSLQAYWFCRRRLDKGVFEDQECIPQCADTDEMATLKSSNEYPENNLVCSQTCVDEFGNCHRFHKTRRGKTCNQAYNICRRQINKGFRRLADAGCTHRCQDTKSMLDLKSCRNSNEGDGGGLPTIPDPSPTSNCSPNCVIEFRRCHDFHNNRQGKTCIEAYNICRRQINQEFDRLANAGCLPRCTDTDDMIDLQSCDGSNGNNGNNPTAESRCTPGSRFSSNNPGIVYIVYCILTRNSNIAYKKH